MNKEECHQYLLHRLIDREKEVKVDKEELEVQETQVETLGDQGLRGVRTPRQSSTRRAGPRLSLHRGKRKDEASGTS